MFDMMAVYQVTLAPVEPSEYVTRGLGVITDDTIYLCDYDIERLLVSRWDEFADVARSITVLTPVAGPDTGGRTVKRIEAEPLAPLRFRVYWGKP